jgi:5-methylcytosine-specific restriction enzyme subunit McrC
MPVSHWLLHADHGLAPIWRSVTPLGRLDAEDLGAQRHSLLRVLVGWFCDELSLQFHQGLLRGYVTQHETLPTVRGRWRPALYALRSPGRVDRLNCEFDELTANNPHHQVLKAALRRAEPLVMGSEGMHRRVAELLAWLADVDDVHVSLAQLERLPRIRMNQHYERALMMARWFLASESPDLRQGRHDGMALLFNMNALFQATLGQLIRRVLPEGLSLREEGPRRFLTSTAEGDQRFQMRPDLCLLRGDEVVAIIDAKWKHLTPEAADGRWGVGQADAYQMHAYAHAYGCPRVTLWYPANGVDGSRPQFAFASQLQGLNSTLAVDWLHIGATANGHWMEAQLEQVRTGLARALQCQAGSEVV